MRIQLSDHFTYQKLLRFTAPSIMMMIFTSIYSVVDGLFVSNFVGKTPFAALNFIFPFIMLLSAVGFMLGTGGSALVAKTMGEGKMERANRLFSMFTYVAIVSGIMIAVIGILVLRPVASFLGAEGEMLEYCVSYGRILMAVMPAFMLQTMFQTFFVTAEKPELGFKITVAAGVANMFLDWLFIAVFGWGLEGAAWATGLSQVLGGVIPVIYFARPNSSLLRLTGLTFDGRALLRGCTNGISELVSNISMSLVGLLFNVQLMAYAGENGVAAYGIIMYVDFIFLATFIGYSMGSAPVVSFHYGAGNTDELKSLLRKSIVIIGIASVSMFAIAEMAARPLSLIFASYDKELLDMTIHGFRIYAVSFFFVGFAIFGSGFFTALNNGIVSAIISFLRTLVFEVIAVLTLPLIFGLNGIWLAIVLARGLAIIVTMFFLVKKQPEYRYY
ncbi:MAG: MATE family efflux transporter [Peptococcaceae bacterium]|nr:MATE family efflux transporter [Peptococcaceae bacterium]